MLRSTTRHTTSVRSLFEKPDWYFSRRAFDIRIRVETVQELLASPERVRLLDIGCGDGSISLPLLNETVDLTLLDLSATMLSLSQSRTPEHLVSNVRVVNDDFMHALLEPQSFDTILCIGLLAHVESPPDVVAKIARCMRPDGIVVVECTDSAHFCSRLVTLLDRLRGLFRPAPYRLQPITYPQICDLFERHQLRPVRTFRYLAPFPGVHRLLSQRMLYRLSRWIFGTSASNRNQWLGNEYIAIFAGRLKDSTSKFIAVTLGFFNMAECLESVIAVALLPLG
jgi:ubiquinone/menaquinone biosynthesis C-methylase UbiE